MTSYYHHHQHQPDYQQDRSGSSSSRDAYKALQHSCETYRAQIENSLRVHLIKFFCSLYQNSVTKFVPPQHHPSYPTDHNNARFDLDIAIPGFYPDNYDDENDGDHESDTELQQRRENEWNQAYMRRFLTFKDELASVMNPNFDVDRRVLLKPEIASLLLQRLPDYVQQYMQAQMRIRQLANDEAKTACPPLPTETQMKTFLKQVMADASETFAQNPELFERDEDFANLQQQSANIETIAAVIVNAINEQLLMMVPALPQLAAPQVSALSHYGFSSAVASPGPGPLYAHQVYGAPMSTSSVLQPALAENTASTGNTASTANTANTANTSKPRMRPTHQFEDEREPDRASRRGGRVSAGKGSRKGKDQKATHDDKGDEKRSVHSMHSIGRWSASRMHQHASSAPAKESNADTEASLPPVTPSKPAAPSEPIRIGDLLRNIRAQSVVGGAGIAGGTSTQKEPVAHAPRDRDNARSAKVPSGLGLDNEFLSRLSFTMPARRG